MFNRFSFSFLFATLVIVNQGCGSSEQSDGESAGASCPVYVDASRPQSAASNGASWAQAFPLLQDGVDAAAAAVESGAFASCQVWVAKGTYLPTATRMASGSERAKSLLLRPNVAVYGGFSGTETVLEERNPLAQLTTISGDVGVPGDDSDNAYHVITGANDATLDGFTITAGRADGQSEGDEDSGGGMFNASVSPTVRSCTFHGNSAKAIGGGMFNSDAAPTIDDCTFTANTAGINGGGIANSGSSTTITKSHFRGNSAESEGGGMSNHDSSSTVTDSSFAENTATLGGGMHNRYGVPTVTNCTFTDNSAGTGGGMANDGSSPNVAGSTFQGNSASQGGGMDNSYAATAVVTDCIFRANSASGYTNSAGGGMSNTFSSPIVKRCMFELNSANDGGGLGVVSSAGSVVGCVFSNNSATTGGGVHAVNSAMTIINSRFSDNHASNDGGGLYVNQWGEGDDPGASPQIVNCTFYQNAAVGGGGGVYNLLSGSPEIVNCTLWGNSAGYGEPSIGSSSATALPRISFSNVQHGCESIENAVCGEGNIDSDPVFAISSEGGLYPSANSPCVDAGSTAALPADLADSDDDGDSAEPLPVDLDGNPRVVGAAVDMGAYEAQP